MPITIQLCFMKTTINIIKRQKYYTKNLLNLTQNFLQLTTIQPYFITIILVIIERQKDLSKKQLNLTLKIKMLTKIINLCINVNINQVLIKHLIIHNNNNIIINIINRFSKINKVRLKTKVKEILGYFKTLILKI